MKPYKKLVLVEFRNGTPGLREFTSYSPITFEMIKTYLESEGADWEEDSFTIFDDCDIEEVLI